MMFSFIHQWGNKPINKTSFTILAIVLAVSIIFTGIVCFRFVLTIDEKFVIIKSIFYTHVKIPIDKIIECQYRTDCKPFMGSRIFSKKEIGKDLFRFYKASRKHKDEKRQNLPYCHQKRRNN